MALLLARCMSPGLSRLLGLTDIRIQGRFGDAHQVTDVLHRNLFFLVELHRPLPFGPWERLGTPAEPAVRPCHTQPGLGAFLDQLALKLGERSKDMKRQFTAGGRRIQGCVQTAQAHAFLLQPRHPRDEILQRPPEPVEPRRRHGSWCPLGA